MSGVEVGEYRVTPEGWEGLPPAARAQQQVLVKRLEECSDALWVVTRPGSVLTKQGEWEYWPARVTQAWSKAHALPLDEALELASTVVDTMLLSPLARRQ